jgi:hypothetical protein
VNTRPLRYPLRTSLQVGVLQGIVMNDEEQTYTAIWNKGSTTAVLLVDFYDGVDAVWSGQAVLLVPAHGFAFGPLSAPVPIDGGSAVYKKVDGDGDVYVLAFGSTATGATVEAKEIAPPS